MSQQGVAALIAELDESRAQVKKLVRGKTTKVLATRPPNGNWSIVENVRHLIFAEQAHLQRWLLPDRFAWSPIGLAVRASDYFAPMGSQPTNDLSKVLAEWDAIHRSVRNALKSAPPKEAVRALQRNLKHLRTHTRIIERLLRRAGM